jgi:hypothetical protein
MSARPVAERAEISMTSAISLSGSVGIGLGLPAGAGAAAAAQDGRLERVREMLRKHKNLWCDLAFRIDHASGGKVDAGWRAAFLEFQDRFMVGTDSFTPER